MFTTTTAATTTTNNNNDNTLYLYGHCHTRNSAPSASHKKAYNGHGAQGIKIKIGKNSDRIS